MINLGPNPPPPHRLLDRPHLHPKSPQIQAIFFWNPWVRNIAGLGYVSFLLTWIPFLRDRLLAPFRTSLLADANLLNQDPNTHYFTTSQVFTFSLRINCH